MRYILLITLLFTSAPSKALSDDAILTLVAGFIDRIIAEIKKVGERGIGDMRKRSGKALINADKQTTDTLSNIYTTIHKNEMKEFIDRNIGIGNTILNTRVDESGRSVVDVLKISGIAPSTCTQKRVSDNLSAFTIGDDYWNEFKDYFINEGYSVDTAKSNFSKSSNINNKINYILSNDNAKELSYWPPANILIPSTHDNLSITSAKAHKFAYTKPPTNFNNMEQVDFENALSSQKGPKWLAYNVYSKSIYDVVFSGFKESFAFNSGHGVTSKALESKKDFYHAGSFKRTLANSIKYKAGSIKEAVYLVNRDNNAKLIETKNLLQQRLLLSIMATQRINELRDEM